MKRNKISGTGLFAVVLISVILSNGTVFGMLSPFSVAFLSSLSGLNVLASLLGSTLGYLVFGKFETMLHSFTAMLFLSALSLFIDTLKLKITPVRKAFFTGALVLISDVLTNVWMDEGFLGLVLLLFDGVLTGFLSYCANYLFIKADKGEFINFKGKDVIFIGVAFTSAICALSSFELWFLNWGRIIGIVALLLFARRSLEESVVCGTLTLSGIAIGNLPFTYSTSLIVLSGVIVSLLSEYGRLVQILSFMVLTILEVFVLGVDPYSAGLILDGFVAVLICGLIKELPDFLPADRITASEYASKKLLLAAEAVSEVKDSIDKVAQILDKKSAKNLDWIYEKASGVVCRSCDKNMYCWQDNYGETARAMAGAVGEYKKKSVITSKDLPEYLKKNCSKCTEFADELNGFYNSYLADHKATMKLLSQRKLLENQLELSKEMFIKVSRDLEEINEPKRLKFTPEVSVISRPATGTVSGDTSNSFCDDEGNFYFCLFDGMGQGKRAAVDSGFLSNVVGGLAGVGIEMETVMKTANDCMLCKSSDESFSTADIIKINLKNGDTEIIKAGSAPTYIISGKEVSKISTETFPLGVFTNNKTEKINLKTKEGDIFVIASDGAGDITEFLETLETKNPHSIAVSLLDYAEENNENYADDVSVAVIKLNKNG